MIELNMSYFKSVIDKHNEKVGKLKEWRKIFAAQATDLAKFFLTYPGDHSRWILKSSPKKNSSLLEDCFKHDPGLRGNSCIFDPWNGWWKGAWKSGKNETLQYHIWDQTVENGGQFIQPVTQSTINFVDSKNIKGEVLNNKVDLGINVWSAQNGITGWVSKRQSGKSEELPCVGYSPNPQTLIWITQIDWAGDFYMFFEWVHPAKKQYGIHARTFKLGPKNKIIPGHVSGWCTYDKSLKNAKK